MPLSQGDSKCIAVPKTDDFYPLLLLRLVILTKRGWMCVGTMYRQCWHTILTVEFPIGLSCSKISCAICLQSLKRPYSIKLSCYCAGEAAGGHRDWSGQAALLLTLTPFLVNFRGEVSNIGAPLLSDLSSIAQFVSSIYNQVVKSYSIQRDRTLYTLWCCLFNHVSLQCRKC